MTMSSNKLQAICLHMAMVQVVLHTSCNVHNAEQLHPAYASCQQGNNEHNSTPASQTLGGASGNIDKQGCGQQETFVVAAALPEVLECNVLMQATRHHHTPGSYLGQQLHDTNKQHALFCICLEVALSQT
jgi:hypothetical protein